MALAAAGCARVSRNTSRAQPPPSACTPTNPAPCEPACFAGDGKACAIYGLAVEGVADAPVRLKKNIASGRRALERGCALDDLDACAELQGYIYDYADDKNGACDGYLKLCNRGHHRSCSFAGSCLIYEHGFPHDVERAIALYQASCEKGERVGCRELAYLEEHGEYVEAGWCVTGEKRSYSTRYGTVGGIRPARPVTSGGFGAWELAARWSATDLSDGGGDRGRVGSVGLNWYPVDPLRISIGAQRAHRELADGTQRDATLAELQVQLGL